MFICHEGSVFFGKEDTSLAQVLGKMLYKYFQLLLSVGDMPLYIYLQNARNMFH